MGGFILGTLRLKGRFPRSVVPCSLTIYIFDLEEEHRARPPCRHIRRVLNPRPCYPWRVARRGNACVACFRLAPQGPTAPATGCGPERGADGGADPRHRVAGRGRGERREGPRAGGLPGPGGGSVGTQRCADLGPRREAGERRRPA